MLYLAWKHGGADPRQTYLGPSAREDPVWPSRVRSFIYACGEIAQEEEHDRTQALLASLGGGG